MLLNNYMVDTYFLTVLYPIFDSSPYTVVSYIYNSDSKYKNNKDYSIICNNIYTIIKTSAIAKNGSYNAFCAIMDEVNDNPIMYSCIEDLTKFVQALLCYFILNTSSKYVDSIEAAQEQLLSGLNTKEETGVGARNSVEIQSDSQSVSSWDEYYYNIANTVAANSKCLSRKIGVVVVKDKSIIGTGYNSPPRGIPRCDERWNKDNLLSTELKAASGNSIDNLKGKCPRQVLGFKSGTHMEYCPASHAEESAITNCARMGVETKGATLYCTCGLPCKDCMATIINSGISEIVVTGLNYYDELSRYLLEHSEIKVRKFDFLK